MIFSFAFFLSSCEKTSKSCISDVFYDDGKNMYTCTYKNVSHSFILCLPSEYNSETSLILMLHGLGESAESFKKVTEMEKTANARNYAVVYVDGTVDPKNKSHGKGWHFYEDDFSKNDVEFIVELAKYCQKKYGLSSRAFAVGFSNGGFMVNKLATCGFDKKGSKQSKVGKQFFTGVASVGGMMPKIVWENKKAKFPVGYLQINGTLDDVVPMDFTGSSKNNPNPSMETVIKYYCGLNKISEDYKKVSLSEATDFYDFNSKVGWVIIREGRHNWPSPQVSKVNISSVILDFFDTI